MKVVWLVVLFGWLPGCKPGYHASRGYSYTSNRPAPAPNGRSAEPGVQVLDIELTPDYTILYMTFLDRDRRQYPDHKKPTIAIEPEGRLLAANGARTFRFIRAEGIPVKPEKRETITGDRVEFALFFERLDKGLEYFDLYQCQDTDQAICWNIYDLHVTNPADLIAPANPDAGPAAPLSAALVVTGTVRNAKTNQPISATINYKWPGSQTAADSVQSYASTGGYRLTLDRRQVYTCMASARGYRTETSTLDLREATANQKLTHDIRLMPLAVGDKIALKNIYFEMSKADLLSASFAELDQVVTMMADNPAMKIRLEGHTDIIGDHDKNRQLSKDRVWACRDYLVQQGVGRDRIDAVGYGDTRPLLTSGTDDERRINRRVEFVILTL